MKLNHFGIFRDSCKISYRYNNFAKKFFFFQKSIRIVFVFLKTNRLPQFMSNRRWYLQMGGRFWVDSLRDERYLAFIQTLNSRMFPDNASEGTEIHIVPICRSCSGRVKMIIIMVSWKMNSLCDLHENSM